MYFVCTLGAAPTLLKVVFHYDLIISMQFNSNFNDFCVFDHVSDGFPRGKMDKGLSWWGELYPGFWELL